MIAYRQVWDQHIIIAKMCSGTQHPQHFESHYGAAYNRRNIFPYIYNIFTDQLRTRYSELKREIGCGNCSHRSSVFNQIFDSDTKVLVKKIFYCTKCQSVKYVKFGATTQLLRHSCTSELMQNTLIKSDQTDFENSKIAVGSMKLLWLGQNYPHLTKDELIKSFPGRKTVKNTCFLVIVLNFHMFAEVQMLNSMTMNG